jgi:hypothetical protein
MKIVLEKGVSKMVFVTVMQQNAKKLSKMAAA